MRRERLTFFKILFTVGLLVSLPITLILTNSLKEKRDVRSKAAVSTPTPGKIIFVPFSFSRDKGDEDFLDFSEKAQVRNGFVPPPQVTSGPQFIVKILDANGNQVAPPQKFSLPQLVAIDGIDAQTKKEKAELKKVSRNSHGLTLPYAAAASFLEIINPKGVTVEVVSVQNASSTNNIIELKEMKENDITKRNSVYKINPFHINKAFAGNGSFNIAIIGDNYNGDNLHFLADVNDIAAGLLSIEPFKSNKANIIFYPQLSTVSLCTFTTTLNCNDTLSLQQASQVPYDKVYVLYNGPYAGYAYVGGTLAYGSNATDKSTAVKQGLFIHELAGHVLGGLMDEYSYGTTGISYAPNCSDLSSCPSWSTIPGLGCFSTCGYTNLFRATDNSSVMNTALLAGTLSFDPFSTQIVQGKLLSFLQPSPPTPTLPPPVPTPTVTVIPSPTLTSIPSPTSTLSNIRIATSSSRLFNASLVSTPSITPSPTAIPSPTPLPRCFFPNFCTGPSFCQPENILSFTCDSSAVVCCKVQIPQGNISPTPAQKFDPLPTVYVFPASNAQNYPTPTSALSPTSFLAPTGQNIPSQTTQEQSIQPTTSSQVAPPSPTLALLNPSSTLPSTPPPIPTNASENLPVFTPPTLTPYQVENIIFERATPTPPVKLGLLDVLQAPSRFVNTIIKNFFSLFSGE